MKQPSVLKSEHKGKVISEDIRTAKQAVEKISALGGKWADVCEEDVKICRLFFQADKMIQFRNPTAGIVLFVEKDDEIAFVKAFSGETERVAVAVNKKDLVCDRYTGTVNDYTENMTFRTYNGVWGWRNRTIVPEHGLRYLDHLNELLKDLKRRLQENPSSEEIMQKIPQVESELQALQNELFG